MPGFRRATRNVFDKLVATTAGAIKQTSFSCLAAGSHQAISAICRSSGKSAIHLVTRPGLRTDGRRQLPGRIVSTHVATLPAHEKLPAVPYGGEFLMHRDDPEVHPTRITSTSPGPWTFRTSTSAMSAERLGPVTSCKALGTAPLCASAAISR